MILLALSAAAALAAGSPAPPTWRLTCQMGAPRIFRIGPQLFEAWDAQTQRFGYNLCQSHACVGRKDLMEGEISSPSLTLTVSLDPRTGRASWRTLGASGLKTTSGPCEAKPETK